ncbi:MAG: VWA domain-containing protein [Gallionella sp.]|nr:VWA domain-containing protein [Gallionella sp.]MDD5613050.1 VWA domain-containing protein [Gallionella sp.]
MLPLSLLGRVATCFGFKPLKYFVDSVFRDKVIPVPGSVVYCDLWLAVEHSGIHVEGGRISNIVVDGVAESSVTFSEAECFTSKSTLGRMIYVSCNGDGAVGHPAVARRAMKYVGERALYGLVFKNCHAFSRKCLQTTGDNRPLNLVDHVLTRLPSETLEPTMAALKREASTKLGATKWRLWDWQNDAGDQEAPPEPDWEAQNDYFRNQPLNADFISRLRDELAASEAYLAEIADEKIPDTIRQRLSVFRQTLSDVSGKYEEVKDFLVACRGADFSYAALQACGDDFSALAAQMRNNSAIRELAHKMGRSYISEEKKKRGVVPKASRSEVHGVHRSNDVMRMLPNELLNLEDDTLEVLFYARLLEENLLTYELSGTTLISGDVTETQQKRTGPVVACLDTSGSMQGMPLLKAKALLLAIANILREENRSLHVLLFGSSSEIREFAMNDESNAAGLLKFLQQGFGGGTDFQTPLEWALKIIRKQPAYLKADVLMISDGDCSLTPEFTARLRQDTQQLECSIYSVLCAGSRVKDDFSDEIMVL